MVDIVEKDKTLQLTFKDAMVIYRAEEIFRQLAGLDWNRSSINIDLSAVSEIDSSGIQLLLMVAKSSRESSCEVKINHSQASSDAFQLLHLEHHFGPAHNA